MTDLTQYECENGIATITFNNGKANVFSTDMLNSINARLDQAEAERAIVILRGNDRIFSGGFDLSEITKSAENAKALSGKGSELTLRLLRHPQPVIAAVEGHAIAKGAFVTMSCDFRIGSDKDIKIGLNETQIGMTMHYNGIELARAQLANTYYTRALTNAEIFGPQDAKAAGFLDILVPKDAVYATALKVAEGFKQLNPITFTNNKRKPRKALYEKLMWAMETDKNRDMQAEATEFTKTPYI